MLPQPAERRPTAETLRELRFSCQSVLSSTGFGPTLGARIADLVPSGHPLRSDGVPVEDLAVAVLDPIRDPERYGGALENVEARWHQLGAWVAELGMPGDSCHHLVRAVARTARDVSGDDWDSAASSGWAALQLWMQVHLDAGAAQGRAGAPQSPAEASQPDGWPVDEAPAGAAPEPALAVAEAPAPAAAARPGRSGRRQSVDKLAAMWSDGGGLAAMSAGGAPPEALRAMRRVVGADPAPDDEAPGVSRR
jgi:hypothetical protein